MKFTYIMGISFTKLRLCFHSLLHYQQTFSPLRETLYAGCIKLFAETPELLMHVTFHLITVHKTAPLDCIL